MYKTCMKSRKQEKKNVCCQSQVRKPTGRGVEWAECLLIMWMGNWVQVFSLILNSSVRLAAGIQSAGPVDIWFQRPWVRILHSADEDLSLFDLKIPCLCQSIDINNKHVYHQSRVQKPTGSEVKWPECLLIMWMGYWLHIIAWSLVAQLVCQWAFCLLGIWF